MPTGYRATAEYRRKAAERHRRWTAANPEKVREYRRAYWNNNRERLREQSAERYAANRDKENERSRERHLRAKYGLSMADRDALLASQNGNCAICADPFNGKTPQVDHDHATGHVRGLLCVRCNVWLGRYEKPGVAEAADRYLREHRRLRVVR